MSKAKRARRPAPKKKAAARKKSPSKKAEKRTVDGYVGALPSPQQTIVNRLRALVAAAVPEAVEALKWGQPVYEVNGPMAYVKAYKDSVNFGFWRGALLKAPDEVLQGDGSRMRHMKFHALDEVQAELITRLVRQAAELNAKLGDPTLSRKR